MAKLSNKLIRNELKDAQYTPPRVVSKIKQKWQELTNPEKLFLLITFAVNFVSMALIGCFITGFVQSLLVVLLFILDLIAVLTFNLWHENKLKRTILVVTMYFLIFSLISTSFLLWNSLNTKHFFSVQKEISQVKKTSELLLSSEMADIYIDTTNKKVYSISNISGTKYVNQNSWVESDKSEFYFLYNLGIEIQDLKSNVVSSVCVFPPTPNTTTGYDYLIEFIYEGKTYVTQVFIPGYLVFGLAPSTAMFTLAYNDSRYYNVSRLDSYLLFQSDYSTFSAEFRNVKYASDNEYFYARYNRYLDAFYNDDVEFTPINENNVRFAKSLVPLSSSVKKINFFWVGETNSSGVFIGTTPVIEIIYNNGTCDIAVIKDIDAMNLYSAISV